MELRQVYHAVRGDKRAWRPVSWDVIRPLGAHPWLENEIPFWGPRSERVRVSPPGERTLRALPEIRANFEAMLTGIQRAYAGLQKNQEIGRRIYGPRPVNDGGDEILHGPTLFRLDSMVELCWSNLENHLKKIARYQGNTKAGHLTGRRRRTWS
jgi:hypothetical protein